MRKTKPCHCCAGSGKELDHVAVGEMLRDYRNVRDLSLKQVSDSMGLSLSYLSDLERGRRNWSVFLVAKFKEACQ